VNRGAAMLIVALVFVFQHLAVVKADDECPSVCWCPNMTVPVCADQLISEVDMEREKYAQGLTELDLNGQTVRVLDNDSFTRWNGSLLEYVNMSSFNIVNITKNAFMSLVNTWYLNLSTNKITTVHPDTFQYNGNLWWLLLSGNSITDIHPSTFQYQNKLYHLDISANKISSLKPDTFNYNRNLTWLSLARNNISEIHPSTFQCLRKLDRLDISGNKIISLKSDTFNYNKNLIWLSLARNNITDTHPSTFQNQWSLLNLDISGNEMKTIQPDIFRYNLYLQRLSLASNKITDIHQSTFKNQSELSYLDLSGNKIKFMKLDTFYYNRDIKWLQLNDNHITNIQPPAVQSLSSDISGNTKFEANHSAFIKQHQLETLILSNNQLTHLDSKLFSVYTNLLNLSLAGNNILDINSMTFYALEQLEYLDLSSNNIIVINPLVFRPFLTDEHAQKYNVSKLKYLNLAQNKIRSFDLQEYFPLHHNNDTFCTAFEIVSLDLRGNRLESLSATSVKWIKESKTLICLGENPWRCECSALHEAWQELNGNLTLHCASPKHLQGKTWNVIGNVCSERDSPSVITALSAVTGLLLVGILVSGSFFVVKFVKKLKIQSE
jgi:carboxypeptidase N regulatory subunit